ncbi:hypothetical protein FPV67DRAFT_642296 [Lyophyllum atratum]|nr:hypothetical protein FPV67DRAFT_642296 [Lyophyllum atratum]
MAYPYQLQTSILQAIPDFLSKVDAERVELVAHTGTVQDQLSLFEELAERYHPHPYILVRMAHLYTMSSCLPTALQFYRQAQSKLMENNIADPFLNKVIENIESQAEVRVREILELSSKFPYYQRWVPTRDHKFPLSLPQAPDGHEILRQKWQALETNASSGFSKYLTKLAIETNQVESTFLLTQGSIQDLMRASSMTHLRHMNW